MFVLPKTLDANVNNPTTFSVGGRKKKITNRKRKTRKTNRKRRTTKKSKRL